MNKLHQFIELIIQPALLRLKSTSKSAIRGVGVGGLDEWVIYPEAFIYFSRYADELMVESGRIGEFL